MTNVDDMSLAELRAHSAHWLSLLAEYRAMLAASYRPNTSDFYISLEAMADAHPALKDDLSEVQP